MADSDAACGCPDASGPLPGQTREREVKGREGGQETGGRLVRQSGPEFSARERQLSRRPASSDSVLQPFDSMCIDWTMAGSIQSREHALYSLVPSIDPGFRSIHRTARGDLSNSLFHPHTRL